MLKFTLPYPSATGATKSKVRFHRYFEATNQKASLTITCNPKPFGPSSTAATLGLQCATRSVTGLDLTSDRNLPIQPQTYLFPHQPNQRRYLNLPTPRQITKYRLAIATNSSASLRLKVIDTCTCASLKTAEHHHLQSLSSIIDNIPRASPIDYPTLLQPCIILQAIVTMEEDGAQLLQQTGLDPISRPDSTSTSASLPHVLPGISALAAANAATEATSQLRYDDSRTLPHP
jgi:hypothetical protein